MNSVSQNRGRMNQPEFVLFYKFYVQHYIAVVCKLLVAESFKASSNKRVK